MKKIFQIVLVLLIGISLVQAANAAECGDPGFMGPCPPAESSSGTNASDSTSDGVVNPQNDLSDTSFMINVGEITPGGGNVSDALGSGDVNEKATNLLEVIISILILPFGVLAIISMTIGGGIMIFSGGRDELLTRGKTLFKGSLIALSIALLSGAVMQLISNLLFK